MVKLDQDGDFEHYGDGAVEDFCDVDSLFGSSDKLLHLNGEVVSDGTHQEEFVIRRLRDVPLVHAEFVGDAQRHHDLVRKREKLSLLETRPIKFRLRLGTHDIHSKSITRQRPHASPK